MDSVSDRRRAVQPRSRQLRISFRWWCSEHSRDGWHGDCDFDNRLANAPGGFSGAAAAANQYNPFYHFGSAVQTAGQTIKDDDWEQAGYSSTQALIEALAIMESGTKSGSKPGAGAGQFCSFAADTEVLMADGATKPISEVEVGDLVLAADAESDLQRGEEVVAVFKHLDTIVDFATSVGSISTTEDHPFWNVTDQSYQGPQDFDAGDLLLVADGETVSAIGLEWHTAEFTQAVNLDVANLDTFFVLIDEMPVLVHNQEADDLTTNQARLEAMRQAGIPTSQQPIETIQTVSGPQYIYEVPKPGGGTQTMAVQLSTTDIVPGHGPHWEAGRVKDTRTRDPLGRYRIYNDGKVKIEIGSVC